MKVCGAALRVLSARDCMGLHAIMPNIASILKAEISRVARKEVRSEIETLKKSSVAHRASIAELRRAAKTAVGPTTTDAPPGDTGTRRRFSATRLAAHRGKLGLSAALCGQLVGVSDESA